MIRFEHLSKTFQTKDGAFEALKDVSFEIEKGDIYGVDAVDIAFFYFEGHILQCFKCTIFRLECFT